jgi:Zn-dependent M16 (insulinase) family peptidase
MTSSGYIPLAMSGRFNKSPVLQTRDASEFNKLNFDLPKGKLLQSLLRIYIVFNEPNP